MKELQELRNEVLNLRNIGELTKQTESILQHKLNALQETISVTRCCERDSEQFCDYCTCKKDDTVTICKECMDENFVD